MKYASFIEKVCERAGVTLDQAEALNRATLLTLAERITGGEAWDLAGRLPKEFRGLLSKNKEDAETFDLNCGISCRRLPDADDDPAPLGCGVDARGARTDASNGR